MSNTFHRFIISMMPNYNWPQKYPSPGRTDLTSAVAAAVAVVVVVVVVTVAVVVEEQLLAPTCCGRLAFSGCTLTTWNGLGGGATVACWLSA